jgi:hypothetical protein
MPFFPLLPFKENPKFSKYLGWGFGKMLGDGKEKFDN